MKYNLILNGSLECLLTISGSKQLTWAQLSLLMDGNTTSSGVALINSDVLDLEVDLSSRIKIDGTRLYISGATTNDIKFYYKNSASENYTTLTTQSDPEYFYTTIPQPSAPRFIRTTMSGITGELYEFQIFNDDHIIGFGTDGSLSAMYLENCPIGETGTSETVPIFNNSTTAMSADAYVVVDYTGSDADNYIKIAAAESGPWYSIDDGAIIEDNKDSSTYLWDMGEFDNTKVSSDSIILDDPTISGGVYTSPIFELDNKFMASYFIVGSTTESGTTSISYNENVYNGTIRVRSSDTKPLDIDEIYWLYVNGTTKYVAHCNVYNGNQNNDWCGSTASRNPPLFTAVNRRNGHILTNCKASNYSYWFIYIYDRNGVIVYSKVNSSKYKFDVNVEFDKFGGVWGYGSVEQTLYHIDNELDNTLYSFGDGSDFLYDLAVEMDGDGVWYTDKVDNMVIHKDYEGTTLTTIILNEPRAICGTLDNGCWVVDNTDKKAYRYNSSGALIKTVNIGRTASRMSLDMAGGFWYIKGNYVYHVTSGGIEDISVNLPQPSNVRGGHGGCIVWSSDNDWLKYIDKTSGVVTRTFTDPGGQGITTCPALFSFEYDDFKTFKDTTNIVPVTYDPVWGTGGSLSWKEVRKDGYFLPKVKYHQVKVTLRNNDGTSTPTLKKLIVAPAVKVEDIQPQTSKNIYVKTVIPDGALIRGHESKIRAWWGVNTT